MSLKPSVPDLKRARESAKVMDIMENPNSAAASPALYYASDNHPQSIFKLRHSVISVRRHAVALPIYAVITGALPASDHSFLESFGITIVHGYLEPGMSLLFLKWRALLELPPHRELLYLDTDTLAFDDPVKFFSLAGGEDFHARAEIACAPQGPAYPFLLNASFITRSMVDHWIFRRIADGLGGESLPVFNTGVMLFRNGSAQRLKHHWKDFLRLDRRFRRKLLPYPCANPHLLEEMVASLVLGTRARFSWSHLPPSSCPCYLEYRGEYRQPGIILHTWSAFYAACIFEFFGRDEALAFHSINKRSSGAIRKLVRTALLQAGSIKLRLPQWLLDWWVRFGLLGMDFDKKAGLASHSRNEEREHTISSR
jgi:hypothetical protein